MGDRRTTSGKVGRRPLPESERGPILHVKLSKKIGTAFDRHWRTTNLTKRAFLLELLERVFFGGEAAGRGRA
jgi:hypothetical protein